MGILEFENTNQLTISSHIITYGTSADDQITALIREEIETMWNEPGGFVQIKDITYNIVFAITAAYQPAILDLDIYQNLDPRNNYFRIEPFAHGNISFVDGLGCNSGYFMLENLYKGSTTAAHEYGHTLGLKHPAALDIRDQGVPGIMYPRGTLVEPQYQYEPDKPAGSKGGTLHPMYRKVLQQDIQNLNLHNIRFSGKKAIIGEFTNIWHEPHLPG